MRNTIFANEKYYHVYNRGTDKRKVFIDKKDYERFLISMDLLNDEVDGLMIQWRDFKKANPKAELSDFLKPGFRRNPLVEINCFCLNPNHYHFILKQLSEKGIENFMHKIGTSYTKYFNKKNDRSGVLFQGKFKAIHIDSNEYLLYLSAYVNRNNFIHGYAKNDNWQYSSLSEYLNKKEKGICEKKPIISQFRSIDDYEEFLSKNSIHLKEKKELEKYLLD